MPYQFNKPESLVGEPIFDNGQCARLVQGKAGAPLARSWRRGINVKDGSGILPGTAIATFDLEGRYPNAARGNHAALFVEKDARGITVVEQWVGIKDNKIAKRYIRFKDGEVPKVPSPAAPNDGRCYWVIE
jgi:hypothetical protein